VLLLVELLQLGVDLTEALVGLAGDGGGELGWLVGEAGEVLLEGAQAGGCSVRSAGRRRSRPRALASWWRNIALGLLRSWLVMPCGRAVASQVGSRRVVSASVGSRSGWSMTLSQVGSWTAGMGPKGLQARSVAMRLRSARWVRPVGRGPRVRVGSVMAYCRR
jgi:hypothetical protein